MNCKEFQEVLPYIIESGGNAEEEEHLGEGEDCHAGEADGEGGKEIFGIFSLAIPMHVSAASLRHSRGPIDWDSPPGLTSPYANVAARPDTDPIRRNL